MKVITAIIIVAFLHGLIGNANASEVEIRSCKAPQTLFGNEFKVPRLLQSKEGAKAFFRDLKEDTKELYSKTKKHVVSLKLGKM